MVLPGLEAYLARAEANLRRLEAEDALLQSSAACLGLLPSAQSVVCVNDPQSGPHCTLTSSDDEDVEQSDFSSSSSDADFQPNDHSYGIQEQAQDRSSCRASFPESDPRLISNWKKAYIAIHRLLREPPNRTWSRREIVRLFTSSCEQGEENLAFAELPLSRTTRWRTKNQPGSRRRHDGGKPGQLESSITVEFFHENTHVRSGAKRLTRRMAMNKDEMYGLYRAQFPDLVRRAALRSAADVDLHGPLSGFLLSRLKIANRMSSAPGWTEVSEMDRRRSWYNARVEDLKWERAAGKNEPPKSIAVKADPDGIKARSEQTFWRIIKRCGVRYVTASPTHNCDIHKNAEVNKRQLQTEQDELKEMEAELEDTRAKLGGVLDEDVRAKATENVNRLEPLILPKRQAITKLQKDVDHATVHFKHYGMALKFVKGIEYNLQPNQVLIYRDFVNQYNEKGTKVNNLIFVVCKLSPDGDGNTIDYINNLASASCNSRFHASAFDRFFRERSDLVPPGTHLFISGDHGPHFWSWDTLMWQSTIYDRYKIKVEIVGLCSYHAYNRCDTHGALIKRAAQIQARKGGGPITSTEFTALINNFPAADVRGIEVCTYIDDSFIHVFLQAVDFGYLPQQEFPNLLLARRAPAAGGIKTMVYL